MSASARGRASREQLPDRQAEPGRVADQVAADRVGHAGQRGHVLGQRPGQQVGEADGDLLLDHPGDLQRPLVGVDHRHLQRGVDPVERRRSGSRTDSGPARRRSAPAGIGLAGLGRAGEPNPGPCLGDLRGGTDQSPAGDRGDGGRRPRAARWCAGSCAAAPRPGRTGRVPVAGPGWILGGAGGGSGWARSAAASTERTNRVISRCSTGSRRRDRSPSAARPAICPGSRLSTATMPTSGDRGEDARPRCSAGGVPAARPRRRG